MSGNENSLLHESTMELSTWAAASVSGGTV